MPPRLSIVLASLLGFHSIGCEKVPTFQELTGQDANKNSVPVVNSATPTVTPEKAALEVVPVSPPNIEDPAAIIAALSTKSGKQTDQEIASASKVTSVIAGLKSLNVSQSSVTDEGVRLFGQFSAVMQVDLSGLQIDGAGIEGLQPLANLRELAMVSVKLGSSTGWGHLGKLSQVETLNLTSSNITDADVSALVTMTGLKELNISYTSLTDAALVHLAKLENLETLRMEGTVKMNGVGLKSFVEKKPMSGLRCLYASFTPLSREGLSSVKKIGSLEVFENNAVQLTDQLISELKGATNLKTLAVSQNKLTTASGLTFRTMRNLENLDLSQNITVNTPVLASLAPLTDLNTLNVTKTNCSVSAVLDFRRLRKKCKVIFDDNPSQ